MWQFQLEQFAQSYRVITPDLRGFGRSSGPGEIITMADLARDLNAILDAAGRCRANYILWLVDGWVHCLGNFWTDILNESDDLILFDTRVTADTGSSQTESAGIGEACAQGRAGVLCRRYAAEALFSH